MLKPKFVQEYVCLNAQKIVMLFKSLKLGTQNRRMLCQRDINPKAIFINLP